MLKGPAIGIQHSAMIRWSGSHQQAPGVVEAHAFRRGGGEFAMYGFQPLSDKRHPLAAPEGAFLA